MPLAIMLEVDLGHDTMVKFLLFIVLIQLLLLSIIKY